MCVHGDYANDQVILCDIIYVIKQSLPYLYTLVM